MADAEPKTVGDYLRKMRRRWEKRRGTQSAESEETAVQEVLRRLSIPRPTLYLWESARSRVDPVDVRRLLTVYGCPETEIAEALRLRSLSPDSSSPSDPPSDAGAESELDEEPSHAA